MAAPPGTRWSGPGGGRTAPTTRVFQDTEGGPDPSAPAAFVTDEFTHAGPAHRITVGRVMPVATPVA
jgi:hypothetical protein